LNAICLLYALAELLALSLDLDLDFVPAIYQRITFILNLNSGFKSLFLFGCEV